ncbi:Glycine receptor subunit alpha-2 [Bulinus truncatus]|nr:Glycine receptor subunit alpha-2 [Bulinus truncatus]
MWTQTLGICLVVCCWFVLGARPRANITTTLNRREVLTHLLNNQTNGYDPRVPPDYEEAKGFVFPLAFINLSKNQNISHFSAVGMLAQVSSDTNRAHIKKHVRPLKFSYHGIKKQNLGMSRKLNHVTIPTNENVIFNLAPSSNPYKNCFNGGLMSKPDLRLEEIDSDNTDGRSVTLPPPNASQQYNSFLEVLRLADQTDKLNVITWVPHSVITWVPHSVITWVPHSVITWAPHSVITRAPHSVITRAPHSVITWVPHSVITWVPHSVISWVPHSVITWVPHSVITWVLHIVIPWAPHSVITWAPHSVIPWAPNSVITWVPHSVITWVPHSVITWVPHSSGTGKGKKKEKKKEDYATDVKIKIHMLSFDSVSETTMDYSVEIYLTMRWLDRRLQFRELHHAPKLEVGYKLMPLVWVPDVYFKNAKKASFHNVTVPNRYIHIYPNGTVVYSTSRLSYAHMDTNFTSMEVDSKLMESVWVPDVYFRNEKRSAFHDVTVPNKYMHIYKSGQVRYSLRLSLTLSCRMRLQKYPLDTQNCPMVIQSYTYTTENVMFKWLEEEPITYDKEIALNTELPQFSIVANTTGSCNGTMDSESPKFACIEAHFTLKRDIGFYIIQVYVPSILIVTLSWVGFWLDLEAIPARVSLGVLTVLTLNTHGSNTQAQLPKVSYIKAIDVWVVSSLIFVFAAFLEFAYVNVLSRRGEKLNTSSTVTGEATAEQKEDSAPMINGKMSRQPGAPNPGALFKLRARRVDKMSRVLFPLSFSVFNVLYWLIYHFS